MQPCLFYVQYISLIILLGCVSYLCDLCLFKDNDFGFLQSCLLLLTMVGKNICIQNQFYLLQITKISTFMPHFTLQSVRMQEGVSKKLQSFRKQIRRNQLEAFKKKRRKELMQAYQGSHLNREVQQKYWSALNHHELTNLQNMSYQSFRMHINMLIQVVFSQQCGMFVDAFQKILVILIDFYEEAIRSWRDEARCYLKDRNVDQMQIEETIDIYAITKVCSFITVNDFLKILGGIYHDINPSNNMTYLRKTVNILKDILHFSFLDVQTIKKSLYHFGQSLDQRLCKTIFKDFILTTFLNISCSEDDQIISMLNQENIFGRIQESAELYGLRLKQLEVLSGLYSNSIDYLCTTIHNVPVQHQEESELHQQQVSSNNLYLPLFQQLLSVQSQAVIQNLVHIATRLLKTSSECNLRCKSYIMMLVETLIRNIITTNQYFPESEQLFIFCANQFDFADSPLPLWLVELLTVIVNNHLMVYYGDGAIDQAVKEKYEGKSKGKILRDINQLLKGCQILLNRCDQGLLEFQHLLVQNVIQLWCKEDVVMGYEQLIIFLQIAIDSNQSLSSYLIFTNFQEEFVHFLDYNYESSTQIRAILQLINSVCNRLQQIDLSQMKNYLRKFSYNWENIKVRMEGYSIAQGQYSQFARNLCERVQRIFRDALVQ